jgi:hypothetical protein
MTQKSLKDLISTASDTTEVNDAEEAQDITSAEVVATETAKETPVVTEVEEKKPKKKEEKEVEKTASLQEILSVKEDTEEVPEQESFWSDLEKLAGETVEVDFGNVDPVSPEGALIYAKAFRDKGIEEFEKQLAELYPKEYQALVLRQEGQDPSILYKDTVFDYANLEIVEEDEDMQKAILKEDMKSQGVSEKRIEALIKTIYNSGDLYTEAQESLKRLREEQSREFQYELERINQEKAIQQNEIGTFSNIVEDVITNGQIGDFVINDKDKKGFYDFLANNIQYSDGNFYAVVPLEKDIAKLNKQLQTEYFRYKNGNLKDIVVKQAITENAKKLRANIKDATTGGGVSKEHPSKPNWNQELKSKLKLGS